MKNIDDYKEISDSLKNNTREIDSDIYLYVQYRSSTQKETNKLSKSFNKHSDVKPSIIQLELNSWNVIYIVHNH